MTKNTTKKIEELQPNSLWGYFKEITQIPRPSKKEEKIIDYLLDFGKKHGLATRTDSIRNVFIKKGASKGMEDRETVILQAHIDMVCEKNANTVHNFETDPIQAYIDGDWVKAKGTTLGADNGIGVAAMLAILADDSLSHGAIECLFTVDEETGLTGAFGLQPGFLEGTILLNLDSEDDGEAFVGCAGGIDTLATFDLKTEKYKENNGVFLNLVLKSLRGGHSGDEIDKGGGNALKILNRFLWKNQADFRLVSFEGGNLRNAIAREAKATVVVSKEKEEDFIRTFQLFSLSYLEAYTKLEPEMTFEILPTKAKKKVLSASFQKRFLNALYACPHGVLALSQSIKGMVETSSNMAAVKWKAKKDKVLVTTSQRSELELKKEEVAETVESVFLLAGASVVHSDGYPGWTPNPDSTITAIAKETYSQLFQKDLLIRSIHAGLECGLILKKYPHLDMISIGPAIKNAHSPYEKCSISSTMDFWKHLLAILAAIPKRK